MLPAPSLQTYTPHTHTHTYITYIFTLSLTDTYIHVDIYIGETAERLKMPIQFKNRCCMYLLNLIRQLYTSMDPTCYLCLRRYISELVAVVVVVVAIVYSYSTHALIIINKCIQTHTHSIHICIFDGI